MAKIALSPSQQFSNGYAAGNTNEGAAMTWVAKRTAEYLSAAGHQVRVFETGDYKTQPAAINAWGPDYAVCIHSDGGYGDHDGTSAFYYSKPSKGYDLAKAIYDEVAPFGYGSDLGMSARPELYEIRSIDAPVGFVEVEFHDTVKGANWILANIDGLALRIARGVCKVAGGAVPGQAVPAPVELPKAPSKEIVELSVGKDVRLDSGLAVCLQPDGNVVIYRPDQKPHWATMTVGSGGVYLAMQPDGNLVLYSTKGPVWQSATAGNPGARAWLQWDGNLVIYSKENKALWVNGRSVTAPPPAPAPAPAPVPVSGPSAQKVLDQFRRYLGVKEGTRNRIPFDPNPNGWPYCARGTCQALIDAGMKIPKITWYSGDFLSWGWKRIDRNAVQPGDILVWEWGDGGITDHVSIAEGAAVAGRVQTLGFNEGGTGAGVVIRQTRGTAKIIGAVRPPYAAVMPVAPRKAREPVNAPAAEVKALKSGERVTCGPRVLTLQPDGNVVAYDVDGKPYWDTATYGKPAGLFAMQPDGNLVLYSAPGHPVWQSATTGKPGASAWFQADGNLVIYHQGQPVWSIDTGFVWTTLDVAADGNFGSETVMALQRWLGVETDGQFGPVSIRALQTKLGVEADGEFGPISTKALQTLVGAQVDGEWGEETTRKLQEFLARQGV